MKKLKMQLDGIKDKLSKEQMKNVTGGYDPMCHLFRCFYDAECPNPCPFCNIQSDIGYYNCSDTHWS